MLGHSFAFVLVPVLIGFFIAILLAKYAMKMTIIKQYKFIAFGASWIWAALISSYPSIAGTHTAIIIALVAGIFCTISIIILVNKK